MRKGHSILFVCAAIVLTIVSLFMWLIVSAHAQTRLIHWTARELGRQLHTRVEVESVRYRFPARLSIHDIYVEDQQGDTLAYIGRTYAHFSPWALWHGELRFPRVDIEHVRAYARPKADGGWNYDFLVSYFASSRADSTAAPFRQSVSVGRFYLHDVAGCYGDEHRFALDLLDVTIPHFSLDSVRANIDLHAANYNGMLVQQCRLSALINDTILTFPRFYVSLPRSELDASGVYIRVPAVDTLYLSRYAHDIQMGLHVNRACFTPADIANLVPAVRRLSEPIMLSADIEGRLDSLVAGRLQLSYGGRHVLSGDVAAVGLPNIDTTYFRAACRDLTVRPVMVQDIVSRVLGRPFVLPDEVMRLGTMHYRGLLSGRMPAYSLNGVFSTALGAFSTRGTLEADTTYTFLGFDAHVDTRSFHIGQMLDNPVMGELGLSLAAQGRLERNRPFDGTLSGHLYTLDNEHLNLDLTALGDWGEQNELSVQMRMNRFHPGVLFGLDHLSDAEFSGLSTVYLCGTGIDDLNGYLTIDSLMWGSEMLEDTLSLNLAELRLESGDDSYHRLLLSSPLVTGRIEGNFDYSTLATTFSKLCAQHVPGLFSEQEVRRLQSLPSDNRLDLYLYGMQLQQLQYMLSLPMRLGDYPVLKAYIDEGKGIWGLQGYVSDFQTRSHEVSELTLSADSYDEACHLDLAAHYAGGPMHLHSVLQGDSVQLHLRADGDTATVRCDLAMVAHINRYNNQPFFSLNMIPGQVEVLDSVFTIAPSRISYSVADTLLSVEHFRIGTSSLYVEANGSASPHPTDSLNLHLSNVPFGKIMPFLLPEKTLMADGNIEGDVTLYTIFSTPDFRADVVLADASLNRSYLGDAAARVYIHPDRDHLVIDADVLSGFDDRSLPRDRRSRVAHVDGYVDLLQRKGIWGIDIRTDSIGLGFVEHWTSQFLTDLGGTVSGHVSVFGSHSGTWVEAQVLPHDAHLTIPFTGGTYYLNDSCFLDSTSIRFPHLTLRDREHHPLYLDGTIHHDCFRSFRFGIDLHMDTAIVVDLPDKAGEILQGKVYASGDVHIAGDDREVRLDANARTVGNSRIRMSLGGASNAANNEFITFVDHNVVAALSNKRDYGLQTTRRSRRHAAQQGGGAGKFMMGLNIEANPRLLYQLVLNDRTGDMIQARGDGALRLTYDGAVDEFKMMGNYTLLTGKMNFTLANTFHRDFTIAEGSSIGWSGIPENPNLNVTAKYHVTASLKDLFGSESESLVSSRTSIPVNTCVHLSGGLNSPTVRFALEFPMSEEAIQTQVSSIINTDEMMMRQVVNLIVFGRFFTPENLKTTGTTTGLNETYSLLSSTVTGQINNWLGKLTDMFTMGVNIRTEGQGAQSSQEYEANFQLTPVNRLVINGNFGYRYNDITNRPFFGDLDVEYFLVPSGKIRAKAFTHTVDKYSLRQASTIQGVGFIFKHDFNWPERKKKTKTNKK